MCLPSYGPNLSCGDSGEGVKEEGSDTLPLPHFEKFGYASVA